VIENLFAAIPPEISEELFTNLLKSEGIRIERIVSAGHASPPGYWYDQDQHEWVILLKGEAQVRFEGDVSARTLHPGDFVNIPAHKKHRVDSTSTAEKTIWLAVHY
jgi:cupin 2 domain-containing protein